MWYIASGLFRRTRVLGFRALVMKSMRQGIDQRRQRKGKSMVHFTPFRVSVIWHNDSVESRDTVCLYPNCSQSKNFRNKTYTVYSKMEAQYRFYLNNSVLTKVGS